MSTPLTHKRLLALSAAGAVLVANPYYIHPIIAPVAADFGVGPATIGLVPALNQIALALGILLLLPLGDRIPNRRLVAVAAAAQFAAVVVMASARSFWLFAAGSTLLGFVSIAPYLLPAYVSKRVAPEALGRTTATLTVGVIAGILVARTGAGIVAEHIGWRAVYIAASALMAVVALGVPFLMDEDPSIRRDTGPSYPALLASLPGIVRANPSILVAGAIQGLGFGVFIAIWLGLGLHLTSPAMGYGVDVVGYLAAFSAVNLVVTPRLGRWADRVGAQTARAMSVSGQFLAVLLLGPTGHSLWLLMIPILALNMVGPTVDIANRMTFLARPPEIRTRLMTVYIVMMFAGAGAVSWGATAAYARGGWPWVAGLAAMLSGTSLVLSWAAWWRDRTRSARAAR